MITLIPNFSLLQCSSFHLFSDYSGAIDDVIIFASTAQYHEIPLHILNTDFYGYISVPMQDSNTLEQEREQFTHMKIENISK